MFKLFFKKIIHKLKHESVESVKDSAKQLGKTVSPGEMLKQVTGVQSSEVTDYLKKLGDDSLTGAALEKRKEEIAQKDEEETAKLRTFLQSTPSHMRSASVQPQPRPYEVTVKELEEKNEKKDIVQNRVPFLDAMGKSKGVLGSAPKKASTEGFERGKDKKSG